ncbi:hypothetical protein Tco_0565979 [Tanacetum coccineum]
MEIVTASPQIVTTEDEEEERARFNAVNRKHRALHEDDKKSRLNLEALGNCKDQLNDMTISQARKEYDTYLKTKEVTRKEATSRECAIMTSTNLLSRWKKRRIEKEDVKPDPVMSEKKAVGTRKNNTAREEAILNDEEESVTPEFLSVRYPIVNWEYHLLGRMEITDMEVYKLTRAYGTISFHGGTESLFRRLDRDDLKVLYKLVQERFEDHSLEEKELILWGDLRMMFDPDEQDEIWKNQESWKVLRWRLYENSGVHSVFLTDTPMEINMLVEKKYPLKKEILEKMINLKLQAKEESTMAFELIKFTRSQIEEKQ